MIGVSSPVKSYALSRSRTSIFDQLDQFVVVDHVDLVEEHDHVRHADLTGEQDVLAGLRHGAVGGGDDQDRAVHLGGTGDHVLDVVGVARAVDVGVVPVSVSYSTWEVAIVMPRSFSSGALSISSNDLRLGAAHGGEGW